VEGVREGEGELRIGLGVGAGERVARARAWLAAFRPGWVSVQFVPYAWDPRGLCFGIGHQLAEVMGGSAVHVMLHELWVGAEIGASWKDRVLGRLQRAAVLGALKRWRPRVVQTTNGAYAHRLSREGWEAEVLPLFGNFPVVEGAIGAGSRPGGGWRVGILGNLPEVWPEEPLLSRLAALGRPLVIEHAGRMGRGEAVWERMVGVHRRRVTFERRGEMAEEAVAAWLGTLDVGIATTPLAVVGKSGSVAAMREAGLPVIVNRDDVGYAGWEVGEAGAGLIPMDGRMDARVREAVRVPARSRLGEVAAAFVGRLERAGEAGR
jgi:hypothetical protein